ncbi:Hsp20/alpha crystallin family protein [Bacillus timonensis]|uniref:Hsp20/alpha crystallin family protein n=1 Tax=Bacillus timonensis TaxID=1033734 RepID=A0A4S3PYY2_9BACI|nr:Hsp20/alpha crystallin family protein [Bacillus timonensis]THE15131.1 Hsp20/alpha crystallin family protein [Bacillus timonensis]
MKDEKSDKPIRKYDHESFGPLMKSMNEFFSQQPIKRLLDTIDDFFERPFPFASIPVEMYETDTELIISAEIPGIKKEQIDIEYSERYVTITVNHVEELEESNEKKQYYVKKHSYNKASRTVALPYPIHTNNLNASYVNGVLKIRIPKQRRRKIMIDESM